jgi:hypothetical protein
MGILHFSSLRTGRSGFALVVTLSLMVLLTVVAVGLLTLSAVTLRESSHGLAMATARANARLGLVLAIGALQKSLGPDQAISATSDLVDGNGGRPHLTGVWESWNLDPGQDAPDYDTQKSDRFRSWLVSTADPAAPEDRDFVKKPAGSDTITLVSGGPQQSAAADEVRAGLVPVGKGAYAWHVADESMKARIDLSRDPSLDDTIARKRALVAGHRSGIRMLRSPDGTAFDFLPSDETGEAFRKAVSVSSALSGLNQADLLAGKRLAPGLRHDLTTHSLGLLTDVRNGGLKRDLTLAFESPSLPSELAGKRLYQSTHGVGGPSDPYWSTLAAYHNSYKKAATVAGLPSYKLENPEPVQITRHSVPRDFTVAPVIARMEVFFTFVVRDAHSQWTNDVPNAAGDPKRKYLLHMVYLPIVTLHNPYNAEIEFERLNLIIRDLPVAFNFEVNGKPQNDRLVPFNEMFIINTAGAAGEKAYMLDLANWTSPAQSRPSSMLKMKPGQTLVCGPYLDPGSTSAQHFRGSAGTKDRFSDGDTASAIKLRPGFAGKAVGMSVDWLTPKEFNPGETTDGGLGVLGLRLDDKIRIESGVRRPFRGVQDHWELEATLITKNKKISYGGMRFYYGDEETLRRTFDETYFFPKDGTITASDIYEPYTKALALQSRGRAVACFSAAARTANGGVYETGSRDEAPGALNTLRDGRLAGKPFLHHNPARAAVHVDLTKDLPGRHTHELNFQPLKGELDDVLELDSANRGPALTGNTTFKGIKTGVLFDLPSGPLQSLAGLRRSNALSSTYLPDFVQPFANSSVSPLMSTSTVRQEGVTSYPLLDHSFLANHALYDSYYFSTLAADGTRGPGAVFADFATLKQPLANQCFQPCLPPGGDPAALAERLFKGGRPAPEAWRESSGYMMVKGAFNVNSTRVLAWKAMLASLSDTRIPVLWAKSLGIQTEDAGSAPIPSMTLPIGGLATQPVIDPLKIDNRRTNEWNGYRSLQEYELDELARRIVEEVKSRGPFLSMSEFVNRRLGPESGLTRSGALQAAIYRSRINDEVFREMVPVRDQDVADPNIYGYQTPAAATGNPAEGAPGWISQGDLLHLLEPRATVRSDSFVVRTCGQARDAAGKVTAKVFAEAVVQRVPAFVDPANPPAAATSELSGINRRFGRRFEVVSFRWLSPGEI